MTLVLNGTTGVSAVDGSAATPAIQGNDSNTGIFFPAADTIAFAEGGVEVGRFDSSANFQFNSGYGSVATAYAARAWVNFNGTGTVAIRASGNVSSITDNGTGDYTVNFTNAMPDANYTASMNILEGAVRLFYAQTLSTNSIRVVCVNTAQTPSDNAAIGVSIFR